MKFKKNVIVRVSNLFALWVKEVLLNGSLGSGNELKNDGINMNGKRREDVFAFLLLPLICSFRIHRILWLFSGKESQEKGQNKKVDFFLIEELKNMETF